MYRVSPMTYIIGGMLGAAIGGAAITCGDVELVNFSALNGSTCGVYAAPMIEARGGYLIDPASTSDCLYCPISTTNQFLARFAINPAHSWRNLGIVFAFIVFNSIMAVLLYWFFRVPKNKFGKSTAKQ